MSNEHNDLKIEKKSYIHYFQRDGKKYKGIKYTNKYDLEPIKNSFCKFLYEDPYEFQQIQVPSQKGEIPIALTVNDELTMGSDIEENSKLLIVRVGKTDSVSDESVYEKTLYVFHNDWLMLSEETNEIFVVDEEHINLWEEKK